MNEGEEARVVTMRASGVAFTGPAVRDTLIRYAAMLIDVPPSGPWKGYYLYGHGGIRHRMGLRLTFTAARPCHQRS